VGGLLVTRGRNRFVYVVFRKTLQCFVLADDANRIFIRMQKVGATLINVNHLAYSMHIFG